MTKSILSKSLKSFYDKSKTKASDEKNEQEQIIEVLRSRIEVVISKIKKQNIVKLNYINDRISETDRILEIAETAIKNREINVTALKETITELDRMSLEDSSMMDTNKSSTRLSNKNSQSFCNDNCESDCSEIFDNLNIQTNNDDTRKLINIISQQKSLLNFYALLTGLQLTLKTSEKQKEAKIPSAYENLSHKEYECSFVPAILEEIQKIYFSLSGTFLLRHNENQGEIEYIPLRKPELREEKNNPENEKLFRLLSDKCYFQDTKAMDFLFLLLQLFLKQ